MNTETAKKYILANYFDGMNNVEVVVGGDEETMAMKLAVKALEKQIPKKVILGYDEQDDVLCPICKIEIAMMDTWAEFESRVYKYCPNCGQALDWRGEK